MLNLSLYKKTDFGILKQWFLEHEWDICSEASIGKNAFMIYDDDKPIAFSYFVTSDINIAYLGFTITDKKAGMRKRNDALDILLKHIMQQAKSMGYEYMLYATNTKAMVKRLEKLELMQVVNSTYGYKMIGVLGDKPIDFFIE